MRFNGTINIGNYIISRQNKVFIIAEAGVNHNGDINIAKKLIDCAKLSGADAVKFQAFKTERLILKAVRKAPYQLKATGSGESQFEMLKNLELSDEKAADLKKYCDKKNIMFLITPFDEESLEGLDTLDLPAYKVASTDITNLPFLKKVARKKKPVILSTGMANFSEVKAALKEVSAYNKDIILLQCTSGYPIKDTEANLRIINMYIEKFNILTGYSDHSSGIEIASYAVCMGAKVIEKHFTLDKDFIGPDHKASLDPNELKEFVGKIRNIEKYLGSENKLPTSSELKMKKSLQKYVVTSKRIKKGDTFRSSNMTAKRTGGKGISPIYYRDIIGRRADRDYAVDEIIKIRKIFK